MSPEGIIPEALDRPPRLIPAPSEAPAQLPSELSVRATRATRDSPAEKSKVGKKNRHEMGKRKKAVIFDSFILLFVNSEGQSGGSYSAWMNVFASLIISKGVFNDFVLSCLTFFASRPYGWRLGVELERGCMAFMDTFYYTTIFF